MSSTIKLKKDELKLAEELKLIALETAKELDLKNLIEKSDVYKTDLDLVKCVIEHVVNETKSKKSESEIQLVRKNKVKAIRKGSRTS